MARMEGVDVRALGYTVWDEKRSDGYNIYIETKESNIVHETTKAHILE